MKIANRVLQGLGVVSFLRLSYYVVQEVYSSIKCATHKHSCLVMSNPTTEYAVIFGDGNYAEEYALQLLKTINVIVIHNNKLWSNHTYELTMGLCEKYSTAVKMYHIKDDYFLFLEASMNLRIKVVINCMAEENYMLTLPFHNIKIERVISLLESKLNFPLFMFHMILKSMAKGNEGAFIELVPDAQVHSFYSITHGMLYQIWRQYKSSKYIYQSVNVDFDFKRKVSESIATLGYKKHI